MPVAVGKMDIQSWLSVVPAVEIMHQKFQREELHRDNLCHHEN
jgi:hypothetical protein